MGLREEDWGECGGILFVFVCLAGQAASFTITLNKMLGELNGSEKVKVAKNASEKVEEKEIEEEEVETGKVSQFVRKED